MQYVDGEKAPYHTTTFESPPHGDQKLNSATQSDVNTLPNLIISLQP